MTESLPSQYTILYSTQSNRSKSCARRTFRILQSLQQQSHTHYYTNYFYSTFNDYGIFNFFQLGSKHHLLISFLSTYGQGDHCDSIKCIWNALLRKSLPKLQFNNLKLALFGLGDVRYGEDYNSAVRKFATRMIQLGSKLICEIGYGNDSNGGVLGDLDVWIWNLLVPKLYGNSYKFNLKNDLSNILIHSHDLYKINGLNGELKSKRINGNIKKKLEWNTNQYKKSYMIFFQSLSPSRAYCFHDSSLTLTEITTNNVPLIAKVKKNVRLTQKEWFQDTRHLSLTIDIYNTNTQVQPPYYNPGDIAFILPSNPLSLVSRFLMVLPKKISKKINEPLHISRNIKENTLSNTFITKWPSQATLEGILTYCTDISSQPEPEDIRSLSLYCCHDHPEGRNQSLKLLELSEPFGNYLYVDYILREKRNWADLFYDFDSLYHENSSLTIEKLLGILPPLRSRQYSIASSPSESYFHSCCLEIDLCVAIVHGTTPLQNYYQGLCSSYLRDLKEDDLVLIWIQPGSFPYNKEESIPYPILCIGSGTGIAPIRSILREELWNNIKTLQNDKKNENTHTLVFGCRNPKQDYYYQYEWKELIDNTRHPNESLRILTAFSRDINHPKKYVQTVLREFDKGIFIIRHVQKRGLIYISGNANMVKDIKEDIINCLSTVMKGGIKDAKRYVRKMQVSRKLCVEAWT